MPDLGTKLSSFVHVRPSGIRSINIERDLQEPALAREYAAPETIRLAHLFDYLVANFQGRLYASLRARPITEALERLNNGHSLIRCLEVMGHDFTALFVHSTCICAGVQFR